MSAGGTGERAADGNGRAGSPPPVGRWFVVAAAGVVLLFLAVTVQKIWSSDTWWQLAMGRWIVGHRGVPAVDEFSHTARGNVEIEMRWLWCALLYLGWRVGAWLLVLAQVVILGATWGLVAMSSPRAARRPAGLLLIALGLCAGLNRWVMRPELATYLMMALYLVLLDGTAKRERDRRGWAVPVLQVFWTNLHTLFVMGPILCWTFAGGAFVQYLWGRLKSRGRPNAASPSHGADGPWHPPARVVGRLVAIAVLTSVACVVNPYGVRGALFTLEIMNESSPDSVVAQTIGEMQSPLTIPLSAWTWDLWAGVALIVATGWTFVRRWRRIDVPRLMVFLGGVYLECKAQRGLGMFAIMAAWAGLRNLDEAPVVVIEGWKRRLQGALAVVVGLGSTAQAWYVATDRQAIAVGAPRETGFGVVEWNKPEGAAAFLLEAGAAPKLFNEMRDGGYLIWRGEGRLPVFVDGRTDVYGEAILRDLDTFTATGWSAAADKWGINTAVIPVRDFERVIGALVRNRGWALVYLDHRDVVFVRDTSANAGVIEKYRIDLSKPWTPRQPEPDRGPERWKAMIGGPGRPWHTQGMAEAFLALKSLPNAVVYLERTLREFPSSPRARAELAAIYRFGGRVEEGDRLAQGLDRVWALWSDQLLLGYLTDAGRQADLRPVLERAMSEGGGGYAEIRVALADSYFQAKEFVKAKAEYEAAMKLGRDTAPEWLKLGFACEQTGDRGGAIRAYSRSLEKDPSQAQAWNQLGMVKAAAGDVGGAAQAFERALAIKPGFEGARRNLEGLRGR